MFNLDDIAMKTTKIIIKMAIHSRYPPYPGGSGSGKQIHCLI